MIKARIKGMGSYTPEKIYDNAYMESIVETNNEWIVQRTGIEQRHIAADDEYTSDLATKAAQKALENAGVTADMIDLIIVATVTPDYFTPSVACVVQKNIGAKNAAAFDMNAACSGFVAALVTGEKFVVTGTYKNVLVIGADALSKATDYKDRGTCILFGDGAGAAVLSASDEAGILTSYIGARGDDFEKITNLAYRNDDAEVAAAETDSVVRQREVAELVNGVARVRDDLAQEDFLVRVNRVDHQVEQTLGFRLKLFFCHGAASPLVKLIRCVFLKVFG